MSERLQRALCALLATCSLLTLSTLPSLLTPLSSEVSAQVPSVFYITDMKRGLRFEVPLMSIHFPAHQPQKIYVGNRFGRIYQSSDAGESWLEDSVLTPRTFFSGASFEHRSAPFSGFSTLNEGILPSPGQLFSFQNLIDLNQRLPQAGNLVRSYFNSGFEGDPSVSPSLPQQRRDRASWRLHFATRHKYQLQLGWRDQVASFTNQRIGVRSIDSHPSRPSHVLIGTADGLYHSRDGGDSWPLGYSGLTKDESSINIVRVNPYRPNEIWVGTEGGLRISRDAGETYQVVNDRFVYRNSIQWITFHPTDPDVAYIGLAWSMIKTEDRGESFQIKYYKAYPPLGNVRRVFVDPHRTNRILLGTQDGLMMSVDEAKSFERAPEYSLIGEEITNIVQGFAPGHYFVSTRKDLWQTFDGGQHWRIAYFGSVDWVIRRLKVSPHERALWIVTSAELLKLSYQPPRPVNQRSYEELLSLLKREPSMSEVVNEALRISGLHRGERAEMRSWARLGGLLPNFDVFYVRRDLPVDFALTNFLLDLSGEISNENFGDFRYSVWGVFAHWDLRRLVHHVSEAPVDYRESGLRKRETNLREHVINLYQERSTLIAALALDPRPPRVTLMRRLRLEELTAHLNALSGDLFAPYRAFDMILPAP